MKNIRILIFAFLLILPSLSYAQKHKKTPVKKKNTCTTFVYNLTLDKVNARDICVFVKLTDHIDMNENRIGKNWDKNYDYWKFSIDVFDNDKRKSFNTEASFYV